MSRFFVLPSTPRKLSAELFTQAEDDVPPHAGGPRMRFSRLANRRTPFGWHFSSDQLDITTEVPVARDGHSYRFFTDSDAFSEEF
jgi:hypothetical protein